MQDPSSHGDSEKHATTAVWLVFVGALPAVPSVFEALEPRIFRTINGTSEENAPLSSLDPIGHAPWGEAFTVLATLPEPAVRAIRGAASRLAVPDDIALLTALGIAFAWFEERKSEPIAMIAPLRDGLNETNMVGLFADIRHFTVSTEGLNFAGVALRLHNIVKERLWTQPGLATQFDVPLVNFEWTDFEERHGFTQHVTVCERNESSPHPFKVAVDQPGRDVWRIRAVFAKRYYTEYHSKRFFDLVDQSFRTLSEDPLQLAWPEVTSQGHHMLSCL